MSQHPVVMTRTERTKAFRDQIWLEWQDYCWQTATSLSFLPQQEYNYGLLITNPNLNIEKYIFGRLAQPEALSHRELENIKHNLSDIVFRHDISIDDLVTIYLPKLQAINPASTNVQFWSKMSCRPEVTPEFIEKYIDKPWNYRSLSMCPNITIDFIKTHIDNAWNWHYMMENEALDAYELMREFPDKLSEHIYNNPTIFKNMDFVRANIHKTGVGLKATHKSVTLELIEANLDLPWSRQSISKRPDLTIPFIKKHKSMLAWELVTSYIGLKQHVFNNPDLPWDYSALVYRHDLTREELFRYITKYNDAFKFTMHPALKFKDMANGSLIKWERRAILGNSFTAERDDYISANYRCYLSAYRIQQHWHRIRSDPRHPVGKKRLEADYASYTTELCKPNPASLVKYNCDKCPATFTKHVQFLAHLHPDSCYCKPFDLIKCKFCVEHSNLTAGAKNTTIDMDFAGCKICGFGPGVNCLVDHRKN